MLLKVGMYSELTKTNPIQQPAGLGQFLRFGGLGWVMNFFLQWVELGSGHKIHKSA